MAETTWSPAGESTVDELMKVAGWGDYRESLGTPWKEGHEFVYRGFGGVHVLGSRHVAIAGDSHTTHLSGDRKMVVRGDADLRSEKDWRLMRLPDEGSGKMNLHVKGDMTWKFHDRMVIGSGTLDRTWYGAIAKIAGMEGVICGGAWNRLFVGGSINMAAIASMDVYGGALRVAGTRTAISGIGYRSSDTVTWRMLMYNRGARVTLEPLPTMGTLTEAKASRLKLLALKLMTMLAPFLFMLWGFITFLPMLLFGLIVWADRKFFGGAKPSLGPFIPRSRSRTVKGKATSIRMSDIIL